MDCRHLVEGAAHAVDRVFVRASAGRMGNCGGPSAGRKAPKKEAEPPVQPAAHVTKLFFRRFYHFFLELD
jgi:hypothetical protein